MKILLCSDFWETKLVGPAHLTQFLMAYKAEDVEIRLLTKDSEISTNRIYVWSDLFFPKFLIPFFIIYENVILCRNIKKIKKNFNFDIVVFVGANGGLLSRFLLPPKIKMIGFINDSNALFHKETNPKWSKKWFYHGMINTTDGMAIRNLDLVLSCSHYLKKRLETEHGFSHKIEVLYQGIDVKKVIFQAKKKLFSNPVKILFVKFDYKRGGLKDLAKALSLLDYGRKFEITVIGPEKLETENIGNIFANIKNVTLYFISSQSSEVVYQSMLEHDIFCVPSRDEALGIANIEALAVGISVVSTLTGGIPEVLNFGKNGWLAEPKNPVSLSRELQNCIESPPSVLEAKRKAGRHFVEKNFDSDKMILEFIEHMKVVFQI